MKNLYQLMLISSFSITAIACAQNYGYPQYSNQNNSNYPSQRYAQYPHYQQEQYRNDNFNNDQNYSGYQNSDYQDRSNYSNDKKSSGWFGSDDKTPVIPDEIITSRIMQNLRNTPYFSHSAKNIQPMTKEGKVTLKGTVANSNEKSQIEYMVKNVDGVKSVSNDLETEK